MSTATEAQPKKKILYAITKSNWGGAQRYVYDLATSLREEYEIVVAAGGDGLLLQRLQMEGIRTISLQSAQRNLGFGSDIALYREMRRLLKQERPDLLHLNSSKMGAIGACAGRRSHVPLVMFTAHGWPFLEKRNALWKLFAFLGSWFTTACAHRTIVISKNDYVIGRSKMARGDYMRLIPLGIDPVEYFSQEDARAFFEQKLGVSFSGRLVGTIAELHHNKDLPTLLRAMVDAPGELVIVGDGEERERLLAERARLGLEGRVHFTGFIPDAARYLKAFDVVAISSQKEGLPYVLLESAFAEVPVIATRVGGIPDVLEERGILVPVRGSRELSAGISQLMSNAALRAAISERLSTYVHTLHTKAQMVQNTKQYYGQITKDSFSA